MCRNRISLWIISLVCLSSYVVGIFLKPVTDDTGIDGVRKAPRWNLPWMWFGMWCNGCPPRSCEDDDAIIHGYCCGCAYRLDNLPVTCPDFLQCPLNRHGLCHDYEYMMRKEYALAKYEVKPLTYNNKV